MYYYAIGFKSIVKVIVMSSSSTFEMCNFMMYKSSVVFQ